MGKQQILSYVFFINLLYTLLFFYPYSLKASSHIMAKGECHLSLKDITSCQAGSSVGMASLFCSTQQGGKILFDSNHKESVRFFQLLAYNLSSKNMIVTLGGCGDFCNSHFDGFCSPLYIKIENPNSHSEH